MKEKLNSGPDSAFQKTPSCFGKLDIVFPMGEDELRHTPDSCMACSHKTDCLRYAMMEVDGLKVRGEIVDRAYQSGIMGFFERWSKKKQIHRGLKRKKKKTEQKESMP